MFPLKAICQDGGISPHCRLNWSTPAYDLLKRAGLRTVREGTKESAVQPSVARTPAGTGRERLPPFINNEALLFTCLF